MQHENLRRGMTFVRRAIALGVTDNPSEAAGYAASRWGRDSSVAIDLATNMWRRSTRRRSRMHRRLNFSNLSRAAQSWAKLACGPSRRTRPSSDKRRRPLHIGFRRERNHLVARRLRFGTSLGVKRAAALTVYPQDLLLDVDPASEESVRRDLAKSVGDSWIPAFLTR